MQMQNQRMANDAEYWKSKNVESLEDIRRDLIRAVGAGLALSKKAVSPMFVLESDAADGTLDAAIKANDPRLGL